MSGVELDDIVAGTNQPGHHGAVVVPGGLDPDANRDRPTGRNSHRQPKEKTFDLRFSRQFQVARGFSLEAIFDIYNAFNWANQYTRQTQYTIATGQNPNFGAIDSPDNRTREAQITLKARF